jgi:hypothetical protein
MDEKMLMYDILYSKNTKEIISFSSDICIYELLDFLNSDDLRILLKIPKNPEYWGYINDISKEIKEKVKEIQMCTQNKNTNIIIKTTDNYFLLCDGIEQEYANIPDYLKIRINFKTVIVLPKRVLIESELVKMLCSHRQLKKYIEIPGIPEKWLNSIPLAVDFLMKLINGKKYDDIFNKKNPCHTIFYIVKVIEDYLLLNNYFFRKFENNWNYKFHLSRIERNLEFSKIFNRSNKK